MVSPKTKSSAFKLLSSSSSSVSSSSPKTEEIEAKTNEIKSGSTVIATPNRGIKRKSTVADKMNESNKTPVKQQKVPQEIDNEDTKKDTQNSETPTIELKIKDTSDKPLSPDSSKSDKENADKNVVSESTKPANETPVRKPTLESMLIRKTPNKTSTSDPPKGNEDTKSDEKTPVKPKVLQSDTEKELSVKKGKRKFGDYKRTKSAESQPKVQATFKPEDATKTCHAVSTDCITEVENDSEKHSLCEDTVGEKAGNDDLAKSYNETKTESPEVVIKDNGFELMDTTNEESVKADMECQGEEENEETTDDISVKSPVDEEKPGTSGVNKKLVLQPKKVNVKMI